VRDLDLAHADRDQAIGCQHVQHVGDALVLHSAELIQGHSPTHDCLAVPTARKPQRDPAGGYGTFRVEARVGALGHAGDSTVHATQPLAAEEHVGVLDVEGGKALEGARDDARLAPEQLGALAHRLQLHDVAGEVVLRHAHARAGSSPVATASTASASSSSTSSPKAALSSPLARATSSNTSRVGRRTPSVEASTPRAAAGGPAPEA
jgi:hypothetical protein